MKNNGNKNGEKCRDDSGNNNHWYPQEMLREVKQGDE